MKKRPVIKPPVQRVSITYFLAQLLVSQGTKRFHRINVLTGMENFPKKKHPFIMVGNHQNGMMDPLNICGMTKTQFHWLTRADVFWNPLARKILLSFNQMPIYRQKDRLPDLRERNDITNDDEEVKVHLASLDNLLFSLDQDDSQHDDVHNNSNTGENRECCGQGRIVRHVLAINARRCRQGAASIAPNRRAIRVRLQPVECDISLDVRAGAFFHGVSPEVVIAANLASLER